MLGTGTQYPVLAIPPFQGSRRPAKTCQINRRFLHFFERRNESSSSLCQQPMSSSCMSREPQHSAAATATPAASIFESRQSQRRCHFRISEKSVSAKLGAEEGDCEHFRGVEAMRLMTQRVWGAFVLR